MSDNLDSFERDYRLTDAVLRIHRDLFEVENLITHATRSQFRIARLNANTTMAALVSGLSALIPTLITLGDVSVVSAPVAVVFVFLILAVLVWIHEVRSARSSERELDELDRFTASVPLVQRLDYMLEHVNACSVRHKIIRRILRESKLAIAAATTPADKSELESQMKRYEGILAYLEGEVQAVIDASKALVDRKGRSQEEHDKLLHWAGSIPKFAP